MSEKIIQHGQCRFAERSEGYGDWGQMAVRRQGSVIADSSLKECG